MAGVDSWLDAESISVCLQLMESECSSNNDVQSGVELILKICRNILKNPTDEKYKKIKKDNKSLSNKVWKYNGGQQLMLAIGWAEVEDSILYLEEKDLSSIINYLEDKLQEYKSTNGNQTSTNTSSINTSWTEEELKEKEIILQQQKEKRLAELKRKKEEEQRLKTQIEADRNNIKARVLKDAKAVERKSGNNVKKFINQGG